MQGELLSAAEASASQATRQADAAREQNTLARVSVERKDMEILEGKSKEAKLASTLTLREAELRNLQVMHVTVCPLAL